MSSIIKVPNIGDFKEVEIIEVLVKNGDNISKGDPVITLESDKSSVEVPSTFSGKIININVKIGDKVSEGDTILEIDSVSDQVEVSKKSEEKIISVTIKKTGVVFVDKTQTELTDLTEALKDKTAGNEKAGVLIYADKELVYQTLFDVIDHVKAAGIMRLSLQAEGKPKALPEPL